MDKKFFYKLGNFHLKLTRNSSINEPHIDGYANFFADLDAKQKVSWNVFEADGTPPLRDEVKAPYYTVYWNYKVPNYAVSLVNTNMFVSGNTLWYYKKGYSYTSILDTEKSLLIQFLSGKNVVLKMISDNINSAVSSIISAQEKRKKELEGSINVLQSELANISVKINSLNAELSSLQASLDSFSEGSKAYALKVLQDLEFLNSLNEVRQATVKFRNGIMFYVITTNELRAEAVTKTGYSAIKIPSVEFFVSTVETYGFNCVSHAYNGYKNNIPHPHVIYSRNVVGYSRNDQPVLNACLGGFEADIMKCLKDRNLRTASYMLITLLQQFNPNDGAGKYYVNWPNWSENQ